MEPHHSKKLTDALPMPLRDVLRGLRAASELSGDIIKPAEPLVPPPVRDLIRATMEAAGKVGSRALSSDPPDPAEIAQAAEWFRGEGSAEALTHVLAWGMEACLSRRTENHIFVSETVTASSLSGPLAIVPSGTTASRRAAELALALRERHVAGPVPGTPLALSADREARTSLAVFTTLLWLLSDRDEVETDEAGLLDLCIGLTATLKDEVLDAFGSVETLDTKFADLAAVV